MTDACECSHAREIRKERDELRAKLARVEADLTASRLRIETLNTKVRGAWSLVFKAYSELEEIRVPD